MAESSRSISIPLATNLHVAFDTELLRTHSAWSGSGLNLFGTPHTGSKSPFLCTIEGTVLWRMPPICPWSTTPPSASVATHAGLALKFAGLNTTSGPVTLGYELAIGEERKIFIHEFARPLRVGDRVGIVRRFTISPAVSDLWFTAHAEMEAVATLSHGRTGVAIQRTNDVLLSLVRASTEITWIIEESRVSFDETLNDEEKGESVIRKRKVSGRQSRAVLRIPPHDQAIELEVLSAVLSNQREAESFGEEFLSERLISSVAAFRAGTETRPLPARAKVFSGERSGLRRESGDEHYRIEHFPVPKEINLQVTGMDWLAKDELAISTWSGEVYVVERATGPAEGASYRRFARGLNEPLGVKAVQNDLYVVQKPELTRLRDTDGDGEADAFESINAGWGYSGNYHAFAFGPLIDKQKNFYAFFCGQRGRWDLPYVGWCVQISPDGGKLEGFSSGLRAPNGFGFYGPKEDLFISDNQGNWVGASKLSHLRRGQFHGFPSGTPAPESEYKHPKSFVPPAVWFPRRWSPSTSGFVTIEDDRFGPFKGQMLIGDFQNAVVLRVFLEKVNGEWQGAVWPFAKGFLSGVNRLAMGPDGNLYVGGLKNAAWAASAPKEYSLDRVRFTGKVPFEISEVHATRGGLELTFTRPVDASAAPNVENYAVRQFTYLYHETYGSPEIDHDGKKDSSTGILVKKAILSPDQRKVQLSLDGAKTGFVTWVRCADVLSATGELLWHDTFYYTMNQVPTAP